MHIKYDFYKNHKLSLEKDIYMNKGLSGIVNTGNKCFSNSIIHCLAHTIKLTDYLLSPRYKKDYIESNFKHKKQYEVVLNYINILHKIWEKNELITPNSFYKVISKNLLKYNNNDQHDSHEFLIDFLDVLHNVLSYKINVNINGEIKNDHDELMKKSFIFWSKMYQNSYSEIIKIFNGLTLNSIQCNHCKYESDNIFESYNCLNINLNNSNTLNSCFDNYFNNTNINDWKCEKCDNYGCTKSLKLWSLPNYLIIQLKRFDENGNKINTFIDFPIDDLDITNHISNKKKDPNHYIYSLYAVNYHSGDIKNGHYWSSIKSLDNTWYTFNDGNINKINNINLKNHIVTSNAYILFYYKKFIL